MIRMSFGLVRGDYTLKMVRVKTEEGPIGARVASCRARLVFS